MRGNQGYRRCDRIPAKPLLDWLALEPRVLCANDRRILLRARVNGFIDFYCADRIVTALACPEMLRVLYGEVPVPA